MPKYLNGANDYEIVDVRNISPHSQNVNEGDWGPIQESIKTSGFWGSLVVNRRDNQILCGNHRYLVAKSLGFEKLPVTWVDLSPEAALRVLLADNRTARLGTDNDAALAELLAGLANTESGLTGTGYSLEELQSLIDGMAGPMFEPEPTSDGAEEDDAENLKTSVLPPLDIVWPTDNEYGIPLLLPDMQADCLTAPFVIWGSKSRNSAGGTVGFYTDDYRFDNLWRNPDKVHDAGFRCAIEPNWSVYDIASPALAIWQTYRKRWISRYWQQNGIRIIVDLNVSEHHSEINLLGIPHGWGAYATRGYTARIDATEREFDKATQHAGGTPSLFVVYGGGKKVSEACASNGWLHLHEEMSSGKHG